MEQVNDNFSKGHTQIPHWLFHCLLLALVDDFRTAKWSEIIPYPELVYQKSQQYLQFYASN